MSEFRFLHLERRRIDQALPDILEEALAAGWRVVVQAASEERVEALNERLWTYTDDGFLPHGSARDGEPHAQPVYLTAEDDNPNGARLRVLLTGVPAVAFAQADYERVALLFDGRDEEAVAEARREWSGVKAAGAAPSYWREREGGGWEKAR
jgi:DNA polymerase-3 subunit chi